MYACVRVSLCVCLHTTGDNDDLNLGLIQPSKRKEWTYSLPTWDSMATLPNIIAHYAEHGDVQMYITCLVHSRYQ